MSRSSANRFQKMKRGAMITLPLLSTAFYPETVNADQPPQAPAGTHECNPGEGPAKYTLSYFDDYGVQVFVEFCANSSSGGGGNTGGNNGGNTGGNNGGNTGGNTPPAKTWEQTIADQCVDLPNLDLLADELVRLKGTNGSGRVATYVRECGLFFFGDYNTDLGRPLTNVEFAIADSSNKMTPNQAQLGAINEYAMSILLPEWLKNNPGFVTTTTTSPATTTTTEVAATTTSPATTTTTEVAATTTSPATTTTTEAVLSGGTVNTPENDSMGAKGLIISALGILGLGLIGTGVYRNRRSALRVKHSPREV